VENTFGAIIEDAVEIFVTGAARLNVLDNHVVVGELFSFREVQAIQNTFETFANQPRPDIVARKARSQRERV